MIGQGRLSVMVEQHQHKQPFLGGTSDHLRTTNEDSCQGSKILLGVTGCIAAYKSCEIVRLLQKRGHDVHVVMTPAAQHFVGKTTFEALTHHPVGVGYFDDETGPIPHITLSQEADLYLIAPATAQTIARLSMGMADTLVDGCALAATCPLVVAPAMNVHMYTNKATQDNLKTLAERGVHILTPDQGYLACGYEGAGKLPDPTAIVDEVEKILKDEYQKSTSHSTNRHVSSSSDPYLQIPDDSLADKTVLITAGPTYEPIDPVRFIGNRSSGKMGAALAEDALRRGANVLFVHGPLSVPLPKGAQTYAVQTAQEMYEAVFDLVEQADIIICAAAVSDYRPLTVSDHKLKKGSDEDRALLSNLHLIENPDILKSLGQNETPQRSSQFIVGFAAETDNVVENARKKLMSKGVDMIIANDVSHQETTFGSDQNEVSIITDTDVVRTDLESKERIASQIFSAILKYSALS